MGIKGKLKGKEECVLSQFGKMRFDWAIVLNKSLVCVEYFGINDNTYREKSYYKIELCKQNNISLIPLYSGDLNSLEKIFL